MNNDQVGGSWQTPSAPFARGKSVRQAEDCRPWYQTITGVARDVFAQVNVSSALVSVIVESFFVPDSGTEGDITNYNANWRIYGLAWDNARSWARLHRVDPDPLQTTPTVTPMPTAYEMASGIRAYRIQGEFDGPPLRTAAEALGTWFLRARFEINTPMPDDVAAALLSRCSLSIANQLSSAP